MGPPLLGVHFHGFQQGCEGFLLEALTQISQPHALLLHRVLGVLLAQLLEKRFGLNKLAVAQAGFGHLGFKAVMFLFRRQGQGAVVLEQGGHPIAGHGQTVAVGFQLGRVRDFQVFVFCLLERCLPFGQKLFGFIFVQASQVGPAGGGAARGAACSHDKDQKQPQPRKKVTETGRTIGGHFSHSLLT